MLGSMAALRGTRGASQKTLGTAPKCTLGLLRRPPCSLTTGMPFLGGGPPSVMRFHQVQQSSLVSLRMSASPLFTLVHRSSLQVRGPLESSTFPSSTAIAKRHCHFQPGQFSEEPWSRWDSRPRALAYLAVIVAALLGIAAVYAMIERHDWKAMMNERDPTEFSVTMWMILYSVLVAVNPPFGIRCGFMDAMIEGVLDTQNEARQLLCLTTMVSCVSETKVAKYIAKRVSVDALLSTLPKTQSLEILESIVEIIDNLSLVKTNRPLLVTDKSVPYLNRMAQHPNSRIQTLLAGFITNVTEDSDAVREKLAPSIMPLYESYRNSPPGYTKDMLLKALHNLLTAKSEHPEYLRLKNHAQKLITTHSPENWNDIINYEKSWTDNQMVYTGTAVLSAAVLGFMWGGFRSGLKASFKGANWTTMRNVVVQSGKLHSLGAAVMYSAFHIDELVNKWVLEPVVVSETSHHVLVAGTLSFFTLYTWAALGFAPFSLVPAIAYPTYVWMTKGDRVVVSDAHDL